METDGFSSFRTPPSAFRTPPSAFRPPPSAFRTSSNVGAGMYVSPVNPVANMDITNAPGACIEMGYFPAGVVEIYHRLFFFGFRPSLAAPKSDVGGDFGFPLSQCRTAIPNLGHLACLREI